LSAGPKSPARRRTPIWIEGVSVVLPVLDHAQQLPRFFENLRACEVLEVLVCDCGSQDGSGAVARDHGAHIFRAASGLGDALNNATAVARGSALWFLAPACLPPTLAAPYILDTLMTPEVAGGYFRAEPLRGTFRDWCAVRAWNFSARWRRRMRLELGFFVSHAAFDHAGGCPTDEDPLSGLMRRVHTERQLEIMPRPMRVRF